MLLVLLKEAIKYTLGRLRDERRCVRAQVSHTTEGSAYVAEGSEMSVLGNATIFGYLGFTFLLSMEAFAQMQFVIHLLFCQIQWF